jgi:hypothetical protein
VTYDKYGARCRGDGFEFAQGLLLGGNGSVSARAK